MQWKFQVDHMNSSLAKFHADIRNFLGLKKEIYF